MPTPYIGKTAPLWDLRPGAYAAGKADPPQGRAKGPRPAMCWNGYAGRAAPSPGTELHTSGTGAAADRQTTDHAALRDHETSRTREAQARVKDLLAARLASKPGDSFVGSTTTAPQAVDLAVDAVARANLSSASTERWAAAASPPSHNRREPHSAATARGSNRRGPTAPRSTARAEAAAASAAVQELEHEVNDLLAFAAVSCTTLATDLAANEETGAALSAELRALRRELDACRATEARLRATLDAQASELDASLSEEARVSSALSASEDARAAAEQSLAAAQREMQTLRAQVADAAEAPLVRAELSALRSAHSGAEAERSALASRVSELSTEASEAAARALDEAAAKHRLWDELQRLRRSARADLEAAAAAAAVGQRRAERVEMDYRQRLEGLRHANARLEARERASRVASARQHEARSHSEAAVEFLAEEHVGAIRELEVKTHATKPQSIYIYIYIYIYRCIDIYRYIYRPTRRNPKAQTKSPTPPNTSLGA